MRAVVGREYAPGPRLAKLVPKVEGELHIRGLGSANGQEGQNELLAGCDFVSPGGQPRGAKRRAIAGVPARGRGHPDPWTGSLRPATPATGGRSSCTGGTSPRSRTRQCTRADRSVYTSASSPWWPLPQKARNVPGAGAELWGKTGDEPTVGHIMPELGACQGGFWGKCTILRPPDLQRIMTAAHHHLLCHLHQESAS